MLCKYVVEDFSLVGRSDQSLVESLVREAEAVWIDPNLMQDGRLQVAYAHWILCNVVPNVIGLAISPRFDASSGHPHGKGVGMVVPSDKAFF